MIIDCHLFLILRASPKLLCSNFDECSDTIQVLQLCLWVFEVSYSCQNLLDHTFGRKKWQWLSPALCCTKIAWASLWRQQQQLSLHTSNFPAIFCRFLKLPFLQVILSNRPNGGEDFGGIGKGFNGGCYCVFVALKRRAKTNTRLQTCRNIAGYGRNNPMGGNSPVFPDLPNLAQMDFPISFK